ncbi:MAG: dihydrofolate reductase [Bacteroidales bacterium]|nr:dihydrofolate reductase [Bacteroidales bacterium]
MAFCACLAAAAAGCGNRDDFRYTVDQFADIKVIRYRVPGWEDLTLQQKAYAYHLAEATKWGYDILWDQHCRLNLPLRHTLEAVLREYEGDRNCEDFKLFEEYAKRVFFSAGVHHHYAEDKFLPGCDVRYFRELLAPYTDDVALLTAYCYAPTLYPQRRSHATDGDIVRQSAVHFYQYVSRADVEAYYASVEDKDDPHPVAYGLNTRVVKRNGQVYEEPWKIGGIYSEALEKICGELAQARRYAENGRQQEAIDLLIDYYTTGDLRTWDAFNMTWVQETAGIVDFINGFIEDYNDPLGRKGSWEGHVNIKDCEASRRTELMAANAQWFEDHAPIDPRFRKQAVKGVSAKVINAVCLGGDAFPATPIGINLPNADWIRKEYGSKSVTIANITQAYELSAQESPRNVLEEFAWDRREIELDKKYGALASEVHTDLHECLGHGSGQLLPGVSSTAMGEYASTLEEARADLFGLYFAADPKLVELGILPDAEAYKAAYSSYIRNGLMVQFNRVELGSPNTEAHMQNRKLIAQWCYEQGAADKVIEKKVRKGKTYFVVNDYAALRELFGKLLGEIQRIKSEGDYAAGKALVETYAVHIDPDLHKEVRARYAALGLKPYGGFINPDIVPVEKDGEIVDYVLEYPDDFLGQMLAYGEKYATLPVSTDE